MTDDNTSDNEDKIKPLVITTAIRSNFKRDPTIHRLLRSKDYFNRHLTKKHCTIVTELLLASHEIDFKKLIPDLSSPFWRTNKRKIEQDVNDINVKKWTLKEEIFDELKEKIIRIIRKKVDTEDLGMDKVTANTSHFDVVKEFCENEGDVEFKYDFDKPDLPLTTIQNVETLQRVRIQVLSFPIKYAYRTINGYICPERENVVEGEQCDSEFFERYSYKTESTNGRIKCIGMKHKQDSEGRMRSKRCGTTLAPTDTTSKSKNIFYYDISYEDEDGTVKGCGAYSFMKLSPGIYECVLYNRTKQNENYHIIAVNNVEANKLEFPDKIKGENYAITLQKTFDDFIKEKTGVGIYGLIPIKIALILQKFSSIIDYPLNNHIQLVGEKSTGKSLVLKYYGILLNNYGHLSTAGTNISIPGLRGSVDDVYIMNKKVKIMRYGSLGSYKSIHIDEAAENQELVQQLKIFLFDTNYGYNKAGSAGETKKRTAHINLSENLNPVFVSGYINGVKKIYQDLKDEGEKEEWDSSWDLYQPLHKYDNKYLRKAIKSKRDEFTTKTKFWIDGYDLALHDRFPFYFYLENDTSKLLDAVIKENIASKNLIKENMSLIKVLFTNDIEKNFLHCKEYESEMTIDVLDKVDKIFDEYSLLLDIRQKEFYYYLLKMSMILNHRIMPNEEDYNLIRYFVETTNRKIKLSEMFSFKIEGAPNKDELQQKEEEIERIEIESGGFDDFGDNEYS